MFSALPTEPLVTLHAVTGDSVVEQRSVALGKGDGELLEQVADGGCLLLPCVAGEGAAQLLDLTDGRLVPGAKALNCQRHEDNALCIAGLPGLVQLSFMGDGESITWGLCSLSHKSCLEGIDNCDVESTIFASSMSWDEHISWLASITW